MFFLKAFFSGRIKTFQNPDSPPLLAGNKSHSQEKNPHKPLHLFNSLYNTKTINILQMNTNVSPTFFIHKPYKS